MTELKVGDSFPSDVVFSYIPHTSESGGITSAGSPIEYNASKGTISLSLPFYTPSILYPIDYPPHHLYPNPKESPANNFGNIEWANKKVILFAVPGAFTPTCSARHLPGYLENLPALKSKGVDVIAVVAYNDAFVMSAWGKANGVKGDDIV